MWSKCNKSKFYDYDRVKFVTQAAILNHNFGYEDASILLALGFSRTSAAVEGLATQEKQRTALRDKKKKKEAASTDYSTGAY